MCKLLAGVGFIFLLSSVAHADWTAGSQLLSLEAGVPMPLASMEIQPSGNSKKMAGVGFQVGGEYFFHTSPQLAFGMDVNYMKFGKKSPNSVVLGVPTKSHAHSTVLLGMAQYLFVTQNQVFFPMSWAGWGFMCHS